MIDRKMIETMIIVRYGDGKTELEKQQKPVRAHIKLQMLSMLLPFSGKEIAQDFDGSISDRITDHVINEMLGETHHDIMMSRSEREGAARFINDCRRVGISDRALLHLERLIKFSERVEALTGEAIRAWDHDTTEPWSLAESNRNGR